MVADSTEPVAFVAVPFPAQGHLNQLLHLSLLVASRGLSVHYAAPAAHVRQARSRLHGWDPDDLSSIHFHDLDVSTYESPAPDPTAPFSNHLLPMWETFDAAARAPLAALLDSLSATHRRVVVVYDIMNTFAAVEAARLGNGEAYGLMCVAISCHLGWLDAGHQLLRKNGGQYVPMEVSSSKEFMEYMFRRTAESQVAGGPGAASAVGLVMNTCRELEGEFIDAIAEHPIYKDKKLFAVGPLNPLLDASASARTPGKTRHKVARLAPTQAPIKWHRCHKSPRSSDFTIMAGVTKDIPQLRSAHHCHRCHAAHDANTNHLPLDDKQHLGDAFKKGAAPEAVAIAGLGQLPAGQPPRTRH
ncbi:hypothetical protein QYE76_038312 [Lolium multiflorum]|uniref:Glycosyltransferase N-terminal domain-containing protein n=1 Tax=Lolium multiflorum TaxID=4521 RepID=A0AAD8WR46_LOLMU|nr:hypothetical protein QYE76_038312 [Lolium multiflorum]